jgi:hypothetical protein
MEVEELKNENLSLSSLNIFSSLTGLALTNEEIDNYNNVNSLIDLINLSQDSDLTQTNSNNKLIFEDQNYYDKYIKSLTDKFDSLITKKAKYFPTAENDPMSDTVEAYNFINQRKQVYSDSQAKVYKNIHNDYIGKKRYCTKNCKYKREDRNIAMIQCSDCLKWFHIECMKFKEDEYKKYVCCDDNHWDCPDCLKKNKI